MAYTLVPRRLGRHSSHGPRGALGEAVRQGADPLPTCPPEGRQESGDPRRDGGDVRGMGRTRAASRSKPNSEAWRLASLAEAAKYGKTLKEPRRQLLADGHGAGRGRPRACTGPRRCSPSKPGNADAHYVLAAEALEDTRPDAPRGQASPGRTRRRPRPPRSAIAWIKARLAQVTGRRPDARGGPDRRGPRLYPRRRRRPGRPHGAVAAAGARRRADHGRRKARRARRGAPGRGPRPCLVAAGRPNRIMRMSLLLEQVQKSLTLTASREPKPRRRPRSTRSSTRSTRTSRRSSRRRSPRRARPTSTST